MTHQEALTVIAKIKPGSLAGLEDLLNHIGENAANNEVLPFSRLDNVHFARLLILPESTDLDGEVIAPQLVLSTNIDASMEAHLEQLANELGHGVDEIFGHCEGYPNNANTPQARLDFLRSRNVEAEAFYVNTVGRTVQQVIQEKQLREAIEDFLDREDASQKWNIRSPSEIKSAIQNFVRNEPSLAWIDDPSEGRDFGREIRLKANKVGIPLLLAALFPIAVPFAPLYAAILRFKEKTDVPDYTKPTHEHLRRTSENEDYFAQNPFSGVGYIKPGVFRQATVRFILWLTKYGANHLYNNGSLTGVRTIHFARWVVIDGGRRTLFMSNYDGSLESYMSDFIDKVAWGLNAVFSNGVGWPRTNWLVKGGAENELEFKNFLRSHQLPTQVWYSAYGDLSATNVANNTAIRRGLFSKMNEQEAEDWLRRF